MPLTHSGTDSVPRQRRHLEVQHLLRTGQCPGPRELASRFNVTERTARRDIRDVERDLNVVVTFNRERGRYDLEGDPTLIPTIALHSDQVSALILMRQAAQQYRGTPLAGAAERAFYQILSAFPTREASALEQNLAGRVRFAGRPGPEIPQEVWDAVLEAIRTQRTLRMRYFSSRSQETSWRKVDPYGLIESDGEWVLHGWCHRHEERRTFNLARIESSEVAENRFRVRGGFRLGDYVDESLGGFQTDYEEPVEVRLRFGSDCAREALERRWHREQRVEREDDGAVVISFETTAMFLVEKWVLGCGAGVEVVAPAKLRASVIDVAAKVLKLNRQA